MKQPILFISSCILALGLMSNCSDNSLVYDGSKLTSKPECPVVESSGAGLIIDYVNKQNIANGIFDLNHSDTVRIIGWAIDENNNTNLNKLLLQVGSKFIEANYGAERPDVQAALNCQSNAVGFEIAFSKSLLQEENGFIADHVDFIKINNKNEQYAPVSFSLLKETAIPALPYHEKNYELAGGGFFVDSYNIGLNTLDLSSVASSQLITLSGWGFDTEAKNRLSNIYLRIGNHIIEGTMVERPDVQAVFSVNDAMIGFTFNIPSYLLNNEAGEPIESLEIVGVNYSNEYIFTPQTYIIKR